MLHKRSHLHWEAYTLQLEKSPDSLQLEKSPGSNEDPAQPKINSKIIFCKKRFMLQEQQTP